MEYDLEDVSVVDRDYQDVLLSEAVEQVNCLVRNQGKSALCLTEPISQRLIFIYFSSLTECKIDQSQSSSMNSRCISQRREKSKRKYKLTKHISQV